ncbi:hypothetical protein AgCh_004848 [Apium graveolens]
MNRTKLPIRKRLENVPQSSGSVDAAVAEVGATNRLVKIMSQTGFIYEKNNFTALVNKGIQQSEDYHKMMDFMKNCKLSYAMLESPTVYCEVVEETWTTAIYNSTDKTITLTIKGFKLGELAKRGKNVYYARFFMILANHLCQEIVLENPNNKLTCWVQERRIIVDLNRANHHRDVPMFYFSVMHTPQLPTKAAKSTTISKSKSKKTPSGISQKVPVEKSTKAKEGSVKEGQLGEGRGEHQRNPKDKVGELSESQPSHTAVSQQTAVLKKDKSSLLAASSQKDVAIEQSSQPRAQAKRVRDTSSPQNYTRNKKSKTTGDAQGTHTVQTGAKDTVPALSQIQIDVAPINVESQPKSLIIEASETPYSPTNSLEVDMINTSIPDSPSLTLLGKPKSSASEHHLLDDLLAHLPILSDTIVTYVPQITSINTESTIVSLPTSFISTLSMDIAHPSSSDCIPTDKLNSIYSSDSFTSHPMDITYPSSGSAQLQTSIISSAEDLMVIQSLLGLREESALNERLGCSQAKGEEKSESQQSISSGLAKVSERSPTLVGEGEGVRVGSQGESLMQQKREYERKAGT